MVSDTEIEPGKASVFCNITKTYRGVTVKGMGINGGLQVATGTVSGQVLSSRSKLQVGESLEPWRPTRPRSLSD